MLKTRFLAILAAACCIAAGSPADAHFLWLATSPDGKQLHLYFSEAAEPDDPALLKYGEKAVIKQINGKGDVKVIDLKKGDNSLKAELKTAAGRDSLFVTSHSLGVLERRGSTFLLNYYAKTGPALGHNAWKTNAGKHLAFELVPQKTKDGLQLTVLWNGKPAADAEVKLAVAGSEDLDGKTDQAGRVAFKISKPGLYSIRAKLEEKKPGELNGKKYATVRHYTTLAFRIPGKTKTESPKTAVKSPYPELPHPVTSFGGAVIGETVYIFGGHMGTAHSYSNKGQSNTLSRLNLKQPKRWENVAVGPRMQGLAMVAYHGKLYRVGGFTAKNKEGEEGDLWSQNDFACFDVQTKKWAAMPSLPEPRSSHDAAMLGSKLYVIGGWQLMGGRKSEWHSTAWVIDLAAKLPKWEALPKPPFQRRALAVAAHQGKVYVIGGMQPKGGPTTRVDIYDPATKSWSQGPSLNGKALDGFGSSAFAVDGRLYVSTMTGDLQQLSDDGKAWKTVQKLKRDRFFHRMLPLTNGRLVFVGGASMKSGKFAEVDVINTTAKTGASN